MTSERDKLIEAVAKAIFFAQWVVGRDSEEFWRDEYILNQTMWDDIGRAALTVCYSNLREVTPAMRIAWSHADQNEDEIPDHVWLAMLDASPLAEGQSATAREDGARS